MSSITVSLVMVIKMSPIVAPMIVMSRIPVSIVIVITAVRFQIVVSIRSIVGSVIIEPEPSVAITKTMTPVASETVATVMVASIMMAVAPVTPGDQFYSHAVFRREPVKIITGGC